MISWKTIHANLFKLIFSKPSMKITKNSFFFELYVCIYIYKCLGQCVLGRRIYKREPPSVREGIVCEVQGVVQNRLMRGKGSCVVLFPSSMCIPQNLKYPFLNSIHYFCLIMFFFNLISHSFFILHLQFLSNLVTFFTPIIKVISNEIEHSTFEKVIIHQVVCFLCSQRQQKSLYSRIYPVCLFFFFLFCYYHDVLCLNNYLYLQKFEPQLNI